LSDRYCATSSAIPETATAALQSHLPPHPLPLEASRKLLAKHHLCNSWSAELAQSKAPKKAPGFPNPGALISSAPLKPT
jgi:hypothetical protein